MGVKKTKYFGSCFECGKFGLKAGDCWNKDKNKEKKTGKWFDNCKSKKHFTKYCRMLKNTTKAAAVDTREVKVEGN